MITTAEAIKIADAELALNKDSPIIYDFDLTNPEYSGISLGDLITINALDYDVVNTVVRIVGIEEGDRGGVAYKKLQVTNPELKTLMKTRNKFKQKNEQFNCDFDEKFNQLEISLKKKVDLFSEKSDIIFRRRSKKLV